MKLHIIYQMSWPSSFTKEDFQKRFPDMGLCKTSGLFGGASVGPET